MSRRNARLSVQPNAQSPVLFAGGAPVLQLNVYNFPIRVSKKIVDATLTSNHITDFRVEKVRSPRVPSAAIISCKYLSTSCDLQIQANGGTLTFQSKDGKVSTRFSVRPHAAVFSRCLPSGCEKTPDLAAAKCLPFDALFRRGVLDTMVKYLDPTDCISLCTTARG